MVSDRVKWKAEILEVQLLFLGTSEVVTRDLKQLLRISCVIFARAILMWPLRVGALLAWYVL